MYIPKRWLLTGALCVMFIIGIGINIALSMRLNAATDERIAQLASSTQVTPVRDVAEPQPPAADPLAICNMDPGQRAAFSAFVTAVAEHDRQAAHPDGPPPHPTGGPVYVSGDNHSTNSGVINDSQFNDGGFGDIGYQWRNVQNNAPVTSAHVSGVGNSINQSVGNTTNVNNNTNIVAGNAIGNTLVVGGPTPPEAAAPAPSPAATTPTPTAPSVPEAPPTSAAPTPGAGSTSTGPTPSAAPPAGAGASSGSTRDAGPTPAPT
jgi:hypothetical protein